MNNQSCRICGKIGCVGHSKEYSVPINVIHDNETPKVSVKVLGQYRASEYHCFTQYTNNLKN